MKKRRQSKSTRPAKKGGAAAATPAPSAKATATSRRQALIRLRDYGLLGGALAFGGWWLVADTQAYRAERDLDAIGDGVPTVVQIHDPNCSMCAALQRETRAAMRGFDPEALRYLVADITTPKGAAFARRHGVRHVTLLLMCGRGEVLQVLTGERPRAALAREFRRHFGPPARTS